MRNESEFLMSLSLRSLLLLRVALDDFPDNTDIQQDIYDLYLFPERLADSYPDEWRAYIRRRLVTLDINIYEVAETIEYEESDAQQPNAALAKLLRDAKPDYLKLVKILKETQMASEASNVSSLKTPLHRWLAWAIS